MIIELEDGTELEFPDGMSPDEIKAAIDQNFPSQELDPDQQRRAEFDAQIQREMAMSPDEWDAYIRDQVKQEGMPYRKQPGSFGLFSNQVFDPFGVADEMVGGGAYLRNLVSSGFDTDKAAEAYNQAAETVRAEQRAAREKFGVVPEIIGGVGTTGVTNAVTALPGFWKSAGQSALTGGTFGGVAGFTHGEGGVGNRLKEATQGFATGAAISPTISHLAVPAIGRTVGGLKDAVNYANRAVRSTSNPQQAAIENVADRMLDANLDPAAIRAQISPPPSTQLAGRNTPAGSPFSSADMADIISRSSRGETAAAIAADYGIAPSTVTRYVRLYAENNPTPLNLIDIAKETVGEGSAMPLTRLGRAAHSLAGDEAGDAAQRLLSRQETQPGRVSNIIQRSVAGGDFEATRAAGLKNLKDEAGKAYKAFYAEPDIAIKQFDDLMQDDLFRRAVQQAQRQERVDIIAANQRAVRSGGKQKPVPDIDQETDIFSPQLLDNIQRQLRIASEGFSDPNNARHARNLRDVLLDRIENFYPTFKGIRQNYAIGKGEFGEEGALEAGRELTTRLGAKTSEALRGYRGMTNAQQELFRLGFARKLMDDAANPQIGGAVANKFNTTAVKEIVEELYPKSDAKLYAQGQRLLKDLRREATTTRTKNDVLSGSRTAELGSDMNQMMQVPQAAADLASGRWFQLLNNLSTRLSTQLGKEGAKQTLKILTEMNPAELLPIMNRLEQAAKLSGQRRNFVTSARELRALNRPAVSGVSGLTAEKLREAISAQRR